MTELFDRLMTQVLLEMPSAAVPFVKSYSDSQEFWNTKKDKSQFLETVELSGQLYDLYVIFSGNDEIVEIFICATTTAVLLGYVQFDKIENNGIEIKLIWSVQGYRLQLFQDFYVNFILKHFTYIRSDIILTKSGYNLYKAFFQNSKIKMTVYDNVNDEELPIHDIEDMDRYYGKDEHSQYQYVIRLK